MCSCSTDMQKGREQCTCSTFVTAGQVSARRPSQQSSNLTEANLGSLSKETDSTMQDKAVVNSWVSDMRSDFLGQDRVKGKQRWSDIVKKDELAAEIETILESVKREKARST